MAARNRGIIRLDTEDEVTMAVEGVAAGNRGIIRQRYPARRRERGCFSAIPGRSGRGAFDIHGNFADRQYRTGKDGSGGLDLRRWFPAGEMRKKG